MSRINPMFGLAGPDDQYRALQGMASQTTNAWAIENARRVRVAQAERDRLHEQQLQQAERDRLEREAAAQRQHEMDMLIQRLGSEKKGGPMETLASKRSAARRSRITSSRHQQ